MWFSQTLPYIASVITVLLLLQAEARSLAPEAIRHVTPVDNPIIQTPSHHVDYLSHFDLTFDLHHGTKRIKLELEPNHNIFAEDAYVQYLDTDGNPEYGEPIRRHEHKVFMGRALVGTGKSGWSPVGWARIVLKRDGVQPLFEGAFSVDHDRHHIELKSTYLQTKRPMDASIEPPRDGEYMVIYRDSDMIQYVHSDLKRSLPAPASCEANQLEFNADLRNSIFPDGVDVPGGRWGASSLNSLFGLSKRQGDLGGFTGNTAGVNLKSVIGDTAGCPKIKKVALVGVAADCNLVQSFASANPTEPKKPTREWIINIVNTASVVYEESFNVSLALKNLTVNHEQCPVSKSSFTPWNIDCNTGSVNWRLDEFSKWRASNKDGNAYWTLMTHCHSGMEVGVSWMGQLCNDGLTTSGSNSVSGANVVVRTPGVSWQIFAHESGHTFGAVHDCIPSTCAAGFEQKSECCPYSTTQCSAGGQFIMNPSTHPGISNFSQCTVGNICSALGDNSVKSGCLIDNRGVVTVTGSVCGNGIVEAGEQCDCGGVQGCAGDPCCNPKTCKFTNGSVCDDSNDSCCTNCQFSAAGIVCRPSTGQCDIAEVCPGNSSACPNNQFKKDGTKCGPSGKGLACASGQCTSRDYQCRSVMGTLVNSNDTWACDNTNAPSCTLVCGSPKIAAQYSYSTCIQVNQNYLDGTPCTDGGHCQNGKCKGSSFAGWINAHKTIFIGVCVAVGAVVLLIILSCIINRCRRSRARRNMPKPPAQAPYGPWPSRMPPVPPQPPQPSRHPPMMNQWPGYPNGGYQHFQSVPPPYPREPPPQYS